MSSRNFCPLGGAAKRPFPALNKTQSKQVKPKHGPVRYSGLRRLTELGFRARSCLVEVWITRSGSLYEDEKSARLLTFYLDWGLVFFGFLSTTCR